MTYVFAALFLLIGGILLLRGLVAIVRGRQARSWPSVTGEIKAVKVVRSLNRKGGEKWRQELEYSYSVAGTKYRGTREIFGAPRKLAWTSDRSRTPYERREKVDVFYSASRPSLSTIRQGVSGFANLAIVVGGILIWKGVLLLMPA